MNTNHNRIRVADLEENQPNKTLVTNEKGELEFTAIHNLKTDSYNALDYTVEGKILDARQGKVLKEMIDSINASSTSLVNDLTTGGTSKALTAEMGKTLENTKLTASFATDVETQITSAVVEDNKVISRSKLLNWWKWIENTVLHKSGNETFSGVKSSTNTGTSQINGLSLTNSATGSGQVLSVKNTDTGIGVRVTNSGSGAGKALYVDNIAGGRGISINNQGTGPAQVFNSTSASTGNLLEFQKNSALTGKFDQNGILTTPYVVLPNNPLTTTLQNGAIERDKNGQLWETHDNARSKLMTENNIIKGEFRNNTEALDGGLAPGDLYNLPIEQDNAKICMVKKAQVLPPSLKLTFENFDEINSDGITNPGDLSQWNKYFSESGFVFSSVQVTGNAVLLISNGVNFGFTLNLSYMGLTNIKINKFDMVQTLILMQNKLTSFDYATLPVNLVELLLSNNQLTDFNLPSPLPIELSSLYLHNNKLTKFDPVISLPNSLSTLTLGNNYLTTFNPSIPLPGNLNSLDIYNNQLTFFNPTLPLPAGLKSLTLASNKLTIFNPTTPLPNDLEHLNLSRNLLNIFNPDIPLPYLNTLNLEGNTISKATWNTEFNWVNNVNSNNGFISIDSLPKTATGTITGSETERLLLNKEWIVRLI